MPTRNGTRGRQIDRTCEVCLSPFLAYASEVNRGRGRCCSPKCASALGNSTKANAAGNPDLLTRLLDKVVRDPVRGCWVWTARATFPGGYGGLKRNAGMRRAHRVSYELFCGPIPEGLEVMHQCDNPPCINPTHLKPGTREENMRDASSKGRLIRKRRSM